MACREPVDAALISNQRGDRPGYHISQPTPLSHNPRLFFLEVQPMPVLLRAMQRPPSAAHLAAKGWLFFLCSCCSLYYAQRKKLSNSRRDQSAQGPPAHRTCDLARVNLIKRKITISIFLFFFLYQNWIQRVQRLLLV